MCRWENERGVWLCLEAREGHFQMQGWLRKHTGVEMKQLYASELCDALTPHTASWTWLQQWNVCFVEYISWATSNYFIRTWYCITAHVLAFKLHFTFLKHTISQCVFPERLSSKLVSEQRPLYDLCDICLCMAWELVWDPE